MRLVFGMRAACGVRLFAAATKLNDTYFDYVPNAAEWQKEMEKQKFRKIPKNKAKNPKKMVYNPQQLVL